VLLVMLSTVDLTRRPRIQVCSALFNRDNALESGDEPVTLGQWLRTYAPYRFILSPISRPYNKLLYQCYAMSILFFIHSPT
jgi:hypothetical protein